MDIDFEKLNEEEIAKLEKTIEFYRKNKERILKAINESIEVAKDFRKELEGLV